MDLGYDENTKKMSNDNFGNVDYINNILYSLISLYHQLDHIKLNENIEQLTSYLDTDDFELNKYQLIEKIDLKLVFEIIGIAVKICSDIDRKYDISVTLKNFIFVTIELISYYTYLDMFSISFNHEERNLQYICDVLLRYPFNGNILIYILVIVNNIVSNNVFDHFISCFDVSFIAQYFETVKGLNNSEQILYYILTLLYSKIKSCSIRDDEAELILSQYRIIPVENLSLLYIFTKILRHVIESNCFKIHIARHNGLFAFLNHLLCREYDESSEFVYSNILYIVYILLQKRLWLFDVSPIDFWFIFEKAIKSRDHQVIFNNLSLIASELIGKFENTESVVKIIQDIFSDSSLYNKYSLLHLMNRIIENNPTINVDCLLNITQFYLSNLSIIESSVDPEFSLIFLNVLTFLKHKLVQTGVAWTQIIEEYHESINNIQNIAGKFSDNPYYLQLFD